MGNAAKGRAMTYLAVLVVGLLVHQTVRDRVDFGRVMVLLGARRNRSARAAAPRIDHLGQVLFVALSAGLSVAAALDFAADEVGAVAAGELRSVLRNARHQGLAVALAGAGGATDRLFAVLARAQLTGASAVKAVASFVDEERRDRRARAVESAQRLPVKLTVPLALLILPGFVLLTFGPTVIATVQRLLGPLLS